MAKRPVQIRLYRLSLGLMRLPEAAISLVSAVHTGWWLALLRRRHLHQLDRDYFVGSSRYLGDEHNLGGLFGWEDDAVRRFFADTASVLVLAAGAGREMAVLAARGLHVDGFECAPELLDLGNRLLGEQGLDAVIQPMERDRCPALSATYQGAIIGWSAYMLIQGRTTRIELLRRVRDHLEPGSPLLLSFFFRQGRERRFRVARAVANGLRRVLGRPPRDLGDYLAPTFVHFFDEEEIRGELTAAGFRLELYSTTGYGHAVGIAEASGGVDQGA
jgi:hypothetical protein